LNRSMSALRPKRKNMRRYRDFNTYLKEIFGERVQKISLDAGMNCPNRDGTLSTKGCIFCDARGSGTGAFSERNLSIEAQIEQARRFYRKRYGAKMFIAYFQSFTNTYAPLHRLKGLYDRALAYPDMVGLAVGTRPDCIDRDILSLLGSYGSDRMVWIEYGLQSAHDATLRRINRGHNRAAFENAVMLAHEQGLNICAHVILGLPGEDRDMMMDTARYISGLPIRAVKIHLLYVVRGTPLADLYESGRFRCLEPEAYAELAVDFLERISPEVVVQRITGDPAPRELLAPAWALEKSRNLARIRETFEKRDALQGRLYKESVPGKGHFSFKDK